MDAIEKLRNVARNAISVLGGSVLGACDEIEHEISNGYMRLPVAHDGEPVHVGAIMHVVGNPKKKLCVSAVGVDCVYSNENHCYALYEVEHHYEPTVEDVIEQALNKAAMLDRDDGYWPSAADITNIVNAIAPKLQLRKDNDA